ncbi:MAG: AI-2E family transporter [Erysipelotrichaceae bacterium]|nr:AI-2E family transporter [Erysipelotrichaceae bacterium]
MFKIFNDPNNKRAITVLSLSGILISLFVILVINSAQVIAFLKRLFTVLSPFIWGILFALILGKVAIKIETSLPKKMKFKTRRFIGALSSVLLLIIVITVALLVVTPRLAESITALSNALKKFTNDPSAWIATIQHSLHLSDQLINGIYEYSNRIVQSIWEMARTFIPNLISITVATVSGLVNFIISFVICLYILIDRQKIAIAIKKFSTLILDRKQYERGRRIMYMALDKFSKFFSGKVVDSFIIGIICFIGMLFINSQYAALVAVIIGLTNIIPFFGPIIGAIPCALILLIVEPFDCLVFVIFVIILQQVDGNIIGPHILGDSVGLSSLWIMFAIIVGGSYFGFFGMLLGVPIFSVIYYIAKEFINERLEEKNKEA